MSWIYEIANKKQYFLSNKYTPLLIIYWLITLQGYNLFYNMFFYIYSRYTMKIWLLLLAAVFSITLVGCATQTDIADNSKPENKEKSVILETVSVEEFAEAMGDSNTTLIDLRTPEELRETGVLNPNVINIDFYASDYEEQLQTLDKNTTYLIYCRSGSRSGRTLETMKKLWFKHVLNLGKGINSWKEAKKEVFTWNE